MAHRSSPLPRVEGVDDEGKEEVGDGAKLPLSAAGIITGDTLEPLPDKKELEDVPIAKEKEIVGSSNDSNSSSTNKRGPGIDMDGQTGLRGAAAIWILLHHSFQFAGYSKYEMESKSLIHKYHFFYLRLRVPLLDICVMCLGR